MLGTYSAVIMNWTKVYKAQEPQKHVIFDFDTIAIVLSYYLINYCTLVAEQRVIISISRPER